MSYIESEVNKLIDKIMDENPKMVSDYKDGKKGLIGFFMKNVIKESTSSFHSKNSKQKLVVELKKKLKG